MQRKQYAKEEGAQSLQELKQRKRDYLLETLSLYIICFPPEKVRFVPRWYSKVVVQEGGSTCYHGTINTCSEGINAVIPLPVTPYDCRWFAQSAWLSLASQRPLHGFINVSCGRSEDLSFRVSVIVSNESEFLSNIRHIHKSRLN